MTLQIVTRYAADTYHARAYAVDETPGSNWPRISLDATASCTICAELAAKRCAEKALAKMLGILPDALAGRITLKATAYAGIFTAALAAPKEACHDRA